MARKLSVEIVGDASSLQRAFGQAGKSSSGLGRALTSLGKVAAVGVGAAFVGLAAVVKRGFGEIAEGQQVMAQTRAGLKSTGGVANVTAKEIENLATSISNMTGIDDEAVQASENMLLTFAKVRNEVGKGNDIFDQATLAVGDMATRMNDGAVPSMEQLSQTSIRVGKALNDPIKGMGALSRVGVQFDEGQRKLITSMVEAGDTMGAQKLILAELTKEFGGSAKAAGETMPGQLAKLSNSFDNVSAKVAEILLPYLMRLVQWTNDHMPEIERVITGVLNAIVATIDFLVPIISKLIEWFQKLSAAAKQYWPQVQAVVETVINWFRTNIVPAVAAVVNALIALWRRFGDDIMAVIGPVFKLVFNVIDTTMRAIKATIELVMALIRGDWAKAWDALKTLVSVAINGIKTLIVTVLTGLVPAVLNLSLQIGKAIVGGLAQGLANLVSTGLAQLQKIPGILAGIAGQAAGWAVGIGHAIVSGILSGVGGLFGALKSKLEGTLRSVLSSLNPFSSVEHGGEIYIGKPLVDGAVVGIQKNAARISTELSNSVRDAVSGFGGGLAGAQMPELVLPPPDVAPTTDALGAVGESITAATSTVATFRDEMAALPGIAATAFQALTAAILKALLPLSKVLEEPRAAVQRVADALHAIGRAAYATRAALQDTVDDIIRLLNKIGGAGTLGGLSGRASGGPVRGGSAYIVGEAGPELFVPSSSGRIMANGSGGGTAALGGGPVIQLVFNGPTVGTGREFEDTVRRALYDVSRRNPRLAI